MLKGAGAARATFDLSGWELNKTRHFFLGDILGEPQGQRHFICNQSLIGNEIGVTCTTPTYYWDTSRQDSILLESLGLRKLTRCDGCEQFGIYQDNRELKIKDPAKFTGTAKVLMTGELPQHGFGQQFYLAPLIYADQTKSP